MHLNTTTSPSPIQKRKDTNYIGSFRLFHFNQFILQSTRYFFDLASLPFEVGLKYFVFVHLCIVETDGMTPFMISKFYNTIGIKSELSFYDHLFIDLRFLPAHTLKNMRNRRGIRYTQTALLKDKTEGHCSIRVQEWQK